MSHPREPLQLSFDFAPPVAQLSLPLSPPGLRVVRGEGQGTGHRRGRLISLPAPDERGLPTREEITLALLQAGADLVAGRVSAVGATAIREAAEEALRRLEAAERDPHHQPHFVRAARALHDLQPRAHGEPPPR